MSPCKKVDTKNDLLNDYYKVTIYRTIGDTKLDTDDTNNTKSGTDGTLFMDEEVLKNDQPIMNEKLNPPAMLGRLEEDVSGMRK